MKAKIKQRDDAIQSLRCEFLKTRDDLQKRWDNSREKQSILQEIPSLRRDLCSVMNNAKNRFIEMERNHTISQSHAQTQWELEQKTLRAEIEYYKNQLRALYCMAPGAIPWTEPNWRGIECIPTPPTNDDKIKVNERDIGEKRWTCESGVCRKDASNTSTLVESAHHSQAFRPEQVGVGLPEVMSWSSSAHAPPSGTGHARQPKHYVIGPTNGETRGPVKVFTFGETTSR